MLYFSPIDLTFKQIFITVFDYLYKFSNQLKLELTIFYLNILFICYTVLSDLKFFFSKIEKPYLKNLIDHTIISFLNFLLEIKGFLKYLLEGFSPTELFVFKNAFIL